MHVTTPHATSDGDPARPLVIANPTARRGRTGRQLEDLLAPLRVALGEMDVARTTRAGHAEALAATAAGERRPLVVSLGGDGTLNEVVNGLLRGAAAPASALPRLGIVATGTGGDFGRSLGIPPRFEAYVAALASGHERPIDVGLARFTGRDGRPQRRHWINVLSGGIGGLVDIYNERAPHWMSGRVAYGQAALRGIVACPRVTLHCRAVLPHGRVEERLMRAHAVAVCNGHTFGGGMLIGPEARPDDGLLQVVSFETRTKAQLVRRFLTVYRGTHVLEAGVNSFVCRSLELTPVAEEAHESAGRRGAGPRAKHGAFPLDIDGDARGDVPLAVELLPGALLVRA
jgi:diacylglycerol kinase family enzyme